MNDVGGDPPRAAMPRTAKELRLAARRVLFEAPSADIFNPNRAPDRGDHNLNPELAPSHGNAIDAPPPRPAAVLVPIIAGEAGLSVLLTVRPDGLTVHAGQVAFPGGKIEPGDLSPLAAALREAEEEIGLDRNLVEPLGYLHGYQTGTGFRIVPVVALVAPEFELELDRREVADTFEVPFEFLMDPQNHRRSSRVWRGRERYFYAMPYGERYIWGATAGMLRNLYERLASPWSASSS